jgi:RNA 2',3'-cyclic 3'-phosphodiesterase
VRLFVAMELPQAVVSAAHAWAVTAAHGLRVLPQASLHVTLAFLGERPEDEVDAIGEAVIACARPVRDLSLAAPAALGRGRALAIDVADGRGEAAALQGCVSDALAAIGAYAPEERRFRPHLTVARGDRVRVRGLPAPPRTGAFPASAVTLFRSHLGRGGARYEPLVSASLHVPGS